MASIMSNVGAKPVRDNHEATEKLSTRDSDNKCSEDDKIHHLPCSISRTVIPTSIAQYRGFFMFIDLLLVCCVMSSQK